MPLLLAAAAMSSAFVFAAAFSLRLLDDAYLRERRAIAADNAAIALGQSVRIALGELAQKEQQLRRLDTSHHAAHHCAQTRVPQCVAADLAAETAIGLAHAAATLRFLSAVRSARQLAASRFSVLGDRGDVHAPVYPPSARRCLQCGINVGWNTKHWVVAARGLVRAVDAPEQRDVRWLSSGAQESPRWQYELAVPF